MSSDVAVSACAGWGAYGISKAAADHLARSFAAELPAVCFLSVDPGEMDTQMHADAAPDADRSALADPSVVAARVVSIAGLAETVANGSRLIAADYPPAAPRREPAS